MACKTWSESIRKSWETDPLECPKRGAEIKIISFIDERLLIRLIQEHLDPWQERIAKVCPRPAVTIAEAIACEESDDDR